MSWKVPVAEPLFTSDERRRVNEVLSEGRITQGRFVAEFEEKMSRFCGVPHAVATSSGTAAVHAALMALDVKAGDEVLTSPLSCIASANPILFQGAKPVFVDIDPETYNMDLDATERLITRRTKAILAVHLFGRPIDMTRLMAIAHKHRLFVIEDACQSLGAMHRGRPVGSFGDIGCFSFYANKIITTGEGGMAVTRKASLYRRMRGIRNLGQDAKPFIHPWVGANYKMSNLHAAIGLCQMKRVEDFIALRRRNARDFTRAFSGLPGIRQLPTEAESDRNVYFSYHLEVDTPALRKNLEAAFRKAGVETRPFFSVIPDQPAYRRIGHTAAAVPRSLAAYNRGVYVSCSPALTSVQKGIIIKTVKESLKNVR